MRNSTKMSSDPLSDILDLADAHCVVIGTLLAGGNWARTFARTDTVKFLAVVRGGCWMVTEATLDQAARFDAGDVVITNGAPAVSLASDPERFVDAVCGPLDRDDNGNLRAGDGTEFMMIGGLLQLHERRRAFLQQSLPPVIHIAGQDTKATKLRWLLTELADETLQKRPGAGTATTHLGKLLFVEALRLHIGTIKADGSGLLTALDDERIAVILGAIHADPARIWTLNDMARLAGMSRTSFAVRFRSLIGVPPLTYVLNWRMQLAQRELSETDHSVATIAWSLGYASESAFSNAFSRAVGMAPGKFRKVN
jgi:AraC-like DNA-binding protein